MKDLIILGTGVHGGEMAEIVERVNLSQQTWNLLGYLTTDESMVGKLYNQYLVLGTHKDLSSFPEASFIPDYEWPFKPEIPTERLITLTDPSSFISRTAKIGLGTVIYPNCSIGLNAKIGSFVFCLSGSIINHDDIIEDNVTLASGVTLAGSVHVEKGSYLGQSCSVRQFTRIGHGSLIGMGSIVVKNVEPHSVMVGNPARKLKDNN